MNISPKGITGTFKILDEKTFFYQDLTGSGEYMFKKRGLKLSWCGVRCGDCGAPSGKWAYHCTVCVARCVLLRY